MILTPKTCKHNSQILCGVVKNLGNCPFPTDEHCGRNNATNWLGMISNAFGSITLKKFRFNLYKISRSVLDNNMCDCCKVIWVSPIEDCPICNMEE